MKSFTAKYRGTCKKCGTSYERGSQITWSRAERGVYYHIACAGGMPDVPHDTPVPEGTPAPTDVKLEAPPQGDANGMAALAALLKPHLSMRVDTSDVKALIEAFRKDMTEALADVGRVQNIAVTYKEQTVQIDSAHYMLPDLVDLLSIGKAVFLHGDPGSGKSTGAEHAAKALAMEYGYISLAPMSMASELRGFIDANGVFRSTVFHDLYVGGGLFCIDEVCNATGGILTALNSAIANGKAAFPDGIKAKHPDFRIVVTDNTCGRGGDVMFPDRRPLDSAFLDRFVMLHWDYDKALEKALVLGANSQHGISWLTWCRSAREFCRKERIRMWVTPRCAVDGASLCGRERWNIAKIADACVFKGIDKDTKAKVLTAHPLPDMTW